MNFVIRASMRTLAAVGLAGIVAIAGAIPGVNLDASLVRRLTSAPAAHAVMALTWERAYCRECERNPEALTTSRAGAQSPH